MYTRYVQKAKALKLCNQLGGYTLREWLRLDTITRFTRYIWKFHKVVKL